MKYNLVNVGDEANITLFVEGEMYTASSDHPNFKAIVAAALEGDESVVALFDVSQTVAKRFERLSERVSVASGRVYFDGEEVNNTLTETIVRHLNEGVEDFKPLVNFFEKIAQNDNSHSREQLYRWLTTHNFTISPEGDIVAYKGVRKSAEGEYSSVQSGPAIVNGEAVGGHVPNPVGAVVEIAKSKVVHDPGVGCASGLHAGTWDYASSFAQGAVLEVHVNPRDVVSVPTDSSDAKMRVCRYKVIQVTDTPHATAVSDTWWHEDSDYYGEVGLDYDCFTPDSSVISSVEWDGNTIWVNLLSGTTCHYDEDYDTFKAFERAPSAGRFWNENLRRL